MGKNLFKDATTWIPNLFLLLGHTDNRLKSKLNVLTTPWLFIGPRGYLQARRLIAFFAKCLVFTQLSIVGWGERLIFGSPHYQNPQLVFLTGFQKHHKNNYCTLHILWWEILRTKFGAYGADLI